MERELDDQRHELFRNEVREFRHEGREEFCAVRFFVGFPAARGLDFPQVGMRAMPTGSALKASRRSFWALNSGSISRGVAQNRDVRLPVTWKAARSLPAWEGAAASLENPHSSTTNPYTPH